MRFRLIYNPKMIAVERIREIMPESISLADCGFCPADSTVELHSIVRSAIDNGIDRLVIAGGDGTVAQTIQAIAPDFSSIELAILPFGTGNDLARSLGINSDLLGLAASYAFDEAVVPIDLMHVAGIKTSYCVNVANGGFGGRVAADLQAADKLRWGLLAYWMTSVSEIANLQTFDVELVIDDAEPLRINTPGIAVANGRYVGGGFPIAPQAMLNDGLLDVVIVPPLAPFELMAAGLGFTLGFEVPQGIRFFRARRVALRSTPAMPFSIDGETTICDDVTFELAPEILRVAVGDFPAALPCIDKDNSITDG